MRSLDELRRRIYEDADESKGLNGLGATLSGVAHTLDGEYQKLQEAGRQFSIHLGIQRKATVAVAVADVPDIEIPAIAHSERAIASGSPLRMMG